MKALLVADVDLGANEGIRKKVLAQARALCAIFGDARIAMGDGEGSVCLELPGERVAARGQGSALQLAAKMVESEKFDLVYVRHTRPSASLLHLLRVGARAGAQLTYEVPTYPYFAEQLRASRRPHRALVKIVLDLIFWPAIYRRVDHLFVVKSRDSVHQFAKMVEITNGVDTSRVRPRSPRPLEDRLRMVTVGTLYPYHGYDRVLRGLQECHEKVGDRTIEFHVVGSSPTVDDLREQANALGLERVVFHGVKGAVELDDMFDDFDLALGCLALHRRKADIDTTLKVVEYCCRGVPVLTSGEPPLGPAMPATIRVASTDEPLDMAWLLGQFDAIGEEDARAQAKLSRSALSWEAVFRRAFDGAGVLRQVTEDGGAGSATTD